MIIYAEDIEEFIEHYGKKGMHWGVKSNRQLNKEARAKEKTKNVETIFKAREKVKSGKSKAELKRAKQAHTANKARLGSYEAKRILNKAKEKHYNEVATSRVAVSGGEVAKTVLTVVGVVTLGSMLGRALTNA